MLGAVVFLWVASSLLVQAIFEDVKFEQPVFLTVFSASCSVSLLLPQIAKKGTIRVQDLDPSYGDLILKLSGTLGLLWMAASWAFNTSLLHTSVATNTVLSSCSSIFTFLFSLAICGDPFRWWSFCAVISSFVGCTVVSLQSPENISKNAVSNTLAGDGLAVLAAALYALVSVMLKKFAPDELDVSLFFGYNGLFAIVLSPFLISAAHFSGVETYRSPSWRTISCLALNALLGSSLANYLWGSAMLLLSPLVATIGLSISIPLSAFADEVLMQEHSFGVGWACGASLVFMGVILAALDLGPEDIAKDRKDEQELQALIDRESGAN